MFVGFFLSCYSWILHECDMELTAGKLWISQWHRSIRGVPITNQGFITLLCREVAEVDQCQNLLHLTVHMNHNKFWKNLRWYQVSHTANQFSNHLRSVISYVIKQVVFFLPLCHLYLLPFLSLEWSWPYRAWCKVGPSRVRTDGLQQLNAALLQVLTWLLISFFFFFSDSSCLLTAKNDVFALVCSSLKSNGYLYGVGFSLWSLAHLFCVMQVYS
jgi:hypothetical protein